MNETIEITTLPNGLRVATDTIPGSQSVALGIWTNCGSRHESESLNGVAHLLEHMLFKGTKRRSARAIAEEMEAVGGQMNAYTGRENTAYYARILKNDAGMALDIIADIIQNSLFDAEELLREQQVVIQEIGQSLDTPDDIIYDYFQEAALPGQAAGRAILGTPASVQALTPEALRAYIRSHYTPQNMVLVAAGGIDHGWLVGEAMKLFANLPAGGIIAAEPVRYKGGDFRQAGQLEQAHLILGFDGFGFHDPDYYAAQVYSMALGGGMSSRLFQEVREKRGLVYTINSFSVDFSDGGLFGIYAGTGEEQVAELMPVLCAELAKSAQGFEVAEIERAKAQLKAGLVMSLESTYQRAEALALNLLTYGHHLAIEEVIAKIDAVDAASLQRVARRLLASRPTLAGLGPLGQLESSAGLIERLGKAA
jgi:predicted Zn-dependent peptidase